jgi:von Willebrand factor type A domain
MIDPVSSIRPSRRRNPLRALAGAALVAGALAPLGGCAMFISLPTTPRLQNLSEEMVFSMAPAPEWPQVVADNPATAPVDIACGIGPRTSSGLLYAAVSVRGRPPTTTLAPLNVSLVLDRSGSMAGAPFRNMLIAADTFITQLRDGDRVSVIAFSDGIYEVVPPVVINSATRAAAIAGIHVIQDGGGTFFSGGLLAGLAEVFSAFQEWQVNQVILFSDGQPNIGITSTPELSRIAARAAERGVSVTTIGFGMDHDELLMQGIADASGGNYYYVDSPNDMPGIFQREAAAILRSAARGTDIDLAIPPGLALEEVIGYDYILANNHVYVRLGSVPHGEERYAVFKFHPAGGGPIPFGVVYADLTRRGRFGVSCAPGYDGARGGGDNWALELAGRAEAAWGMQEAMAWADTGSEPFVISQLGYTRGVIAALRETLGPQALTEEDDMLLKAQAVLGLQVASGAASSFLSGGVSGLIGFGANTAVSTATTAVVYNIDKAFRPRTRVTVQVNYFGGGGTRYVARGTTYKPRDRDGSLRFKRARFRSYEMMRARGPRT